MFVNELSGCGFESSCSQVKAGCVGIYAEYDKLIVVLIYLIYVSMKPLDILVGAFASNQAVLLR